MYPRHEMLDLVVVDGRARGIVTRDLVTGEIESHAADAVVLAHRRLRQRLLPRDQRQGLQRHRDLARLQARAPPSPTPASRRSIPTCIPVTGDYQSKLTLMSESLRNDGRIWVPKKKGDTRPPDQIPEAERDYYLERKYPSFGNLVPRDIASRAAKAGLRRGPRRRARAGLGVYLDFADAIERLGAAR